MEDSVSYQFAEVRQRREKRHEIIYDLILRQQPKHSRMCGIGEKGSVQRADRRPVDPPPIIQLKVIDNLLPSADRNSFLQNPYYFMYASLIVLESSEELHLLRDGRTRSTTGSVVSSLYHLKDIDNADAGFFVFPDLSVRMEGSYRLKFSLFEIVGKEVFHCKSICSEPFTVYSAKRFPGMEESTFLSRSFADQGLKIRIRKEIRIRRRLGKRKSDSSIRTQHVKRQRQHMGPDDEEHGSGSGSESDRSRNASTKQESPRFPEEEYRHMFVQPHSYDPRLMSGGGTLHYPDDKRGIVMHGSYDPYGRRMGDYYPHPMNSHPSVDPRHSAPGPYHSRIAPAYGDPRMLSYGYDPRFGDPMSEPSHIGAGYDQTGRPLQRAPPHWISSGRPSDPLHSASASPMHHPDVYYRGMPPPPVPPMSMQQQQRAPGQPPVYYGSAQPLPEFDVDPRGQSKPGYSDEFSTSRSGVPPPHPSHRTYYGYPPQNAYEIYGTYHPRHEDTYNNNTTSTTASYATVTSTRASEHTVNTGVDPTRSSNLPTSPITQGSKNGATRLAPMSASVKPEVELQAHRYPNHAGIPPPYHIRPTPELPGPSINYPSPYARPYHHQRFHPTQQQPPPHHLMEMRGPWTLYEDAHKMNSGIPPLHPVSGTVQQQQQQVQDMAGEWHKSESTRHPASQSTGTDWQGESPIGNIAPTGEWGDVRNGVTQGSNPHSQPHDQPSHYHDNSKPPSGDGDGGTLAIKSDQPGCIGSQYPPPRP